ncbi:MAG: metallophosphoesterase family protein, partial [Paracoccaceae bacterium]
AICTGDVVAYGADPRACLQEVRDWGLAVVAGNCERQLGAEALDCGCGFAPGTACSVASGRWFAHARAQVTDADRAWMVGLPDIAVLHHAGRRVAVLHGGAEVNNLFLWPQDSAALHQQLDILRAQVGPVDRVLAGHCGLAYRRQVDGVDWINAGVIGMPPNDGCAQTRYVVLDARGGAALHSLRYDHTAAAHAMQTAGLTQGYEVALASGWWPSEDVLPAELRRGSALREGMMRQYERF